MPEENNVCVMKWNYGTKFSCSRSGDQAKRGVELRHSNGSSRNCGKAENGRVLMETERVTLDTQIPSLTTCETQGEAKKIPVFSEISAINQTIHSAFSY